ncbi:MAG: 4Fe-4S binding protein [Candidatus ainarchaeum sp.]|nr:4Fe-4S binding protein [Candidatus ainarchaeum sp.]
MAKEKNKREKKAGQKLTLGAVILEPGSTRNYHTGAWRVYRPVLDNSKCVSCSNCWKVCPDAAIKRTPEGKFYIDYTYCKGCLLCLNECGVKAIVKEVEVK